MPISFLEFQQAQFAQFLTDISPSGFYSDKFGIEFYTDRSRKSVYLRANCPDFIKRHWGFDIIQMYLAYIGAILIHLVLRRNSCKDSSKLRHIFVLHICIEWCFQVVSSLLFQCNWFVEICNFNEEKNPTCYCIIVLYWEAVLELKLRMRLACPIAMFC